MLPNHNPLVVAEQFALLEAAHPGRIDLGIGRAPGGDTVTSHFLRKGRNIERFPDDLDEVLALMNPDGLQVDRTGSMSGPNTYTLRATPRAISAPEVWLLGSSAYSASLAASKVMINTVASAYRDEPIDAIDPRARTLSLLATALDAVNAPDRRAGSAG